jgi:hypothetical protein
MVVTECHVYTADGHMVEHWGHSHTQRKPGRLTLLSMCEIFSGDSFGTRTHQGGALRDKRNQVSMSHTCREKSLTLTVSRRVWMTPMLRHVVACTVRSRPHNHHGAHLELSHTPRKRWCPSGVLHVWVTRECGCGAHTPPVRRVTLYYGGDSPSLTHAALVGLGAPPETRRQISACVVSPGSGPGMAQVRHLGCLWGTTPPPGPSAQTAAAD